ncbi:hypothetical protein HN011_008393, partial [Eciton burchellii]
VWYWRQSTGASSPNDEVHGTQHLIVAPIPRLPRSRDGALGGSIRLSPSFLPPRTLSDGFQRPPRDDRLLKGTCRGIRFGRNSSSAFNR